MDRRMKQKCYNCDFLETGFHHKKKIQWCAILDLYGPFLIGCERERKLIEKEGETQPWCPLLKYSRKEIYAGMRDDRLS